MRVAHETSYWYAAPTSTLPSPLKSPVNSLVPDHVQFPAPESNWTVPPGKEDPVDACRNSCDLELPLSTNSEMSALPSPVKSPATNMIFDQSELELVCQFDGAANEIAPATEVETSTRISQLVASIL